MSVKADLEKLVWLQQRELELRERGAELVALERQREALRGEVADAEGRVTAAEAELDECQKEGRRLELDLKTAEDKVRKYKDQLLEVKTNKELWAVQEEIERAEAEVSSVEEESIEQLERADVLEEQIASRRRDLEEVGGRVHVSLAEMEQREQELQRSRRQLDESIDELRRQLPEPLLTKYEEVKGVRAGVGVAEVRNGICQACNFTLRPQLYVEVRNLTEIQSCENCKRILFARETLELPAGVLGPEPEDVGPDSGPAEAATGESQLPASDAAG